MLYPIGGKLNENICAKRSEEPL